MTSCVTQSNINQEILHAATQSSATAITSPGLILLFSLRRVSRAQDNHWAKPSVRKDHWALKSETKQTAWEGGLTTSGWLRQQWMCVKLKSKQSCLCAGHAVQGDKICVPFGNNNGVCL